MSKKTISLLEIINTKLQEDQSLLPVFDPTALKIQQELEKPDADLKKIERLILAEQALTGQVLKTANSAFYKGLTKVKTIREAAVRLGTGELFNIVMLAAQKKHFHASDPRERKQMEALWRHAIGTAIGGQWLAKALGFESIANEAFTAALLHDVGKLLLHSVLTSLRNNPKIDFNPSQNLISEVLDNFHTQYGHKLLETWNLPESYCLVARDHHLEDVDKDNKLLLLIRLANMACHKLGIGPCHDPDISLPATAEANALGISEIGLAKLEIKLEDSRILSAA